MTSGEIVFSTRHWPTALLSYLGSDGNPRLQPSPQALLAGSGLPGGLRAVPGGKGRRVTAARPLRDLEPEGGGFAAAHLTKWAAAPGPGDAPREGTGPPLSVKAGCDRGTTANRPAAWHRYTRNPALSTEPPAAPEGSKGGQARPAPTRSAARPVTTRPRAPANARNEVNWRSIVRKNGKITRIH